jgi:hypothetical protein
MLGGKKTDSVKKVIARLKAAGIVDTDREVLTIRKLVDLREIANGNLTVS